MSENIHVNDDPLSRAASGIDTSFPLLVEKMYRLECTSAVKAPTKDHPERETLTIKLKTTKEAMSDKGKVINPGFPVTKRIGVTETEGGINEDGKEVKPRTIEDIGKDLATVLKAFFGPKTDVSPRQLLDDPKMLVGKPVDARIGIDKARGSFPASNSVTFSVPS